MLKKKKASKSQAEVQSIVTFSHISHMYRCTQMTTYINNYTYVDINTLQRYVSLFYLFRPS